MLGTTSQVVDASFDQVQSFLEVKAVSIRASRALLSGATLGISFDARLSCLKDGYPESFASLRGKQDSIGASSTTPGSVEILLPTDTGLENEMITMLVSVPLVRRELYPTENIGPVYGTAAKVIARGATEPFATAKAPSPAVLTGDIWGTELTAIWSHVSATDTHRYSYPAFIRLDSIGPSSIPSGTQVRIIADSTIVRLTVADTFLGDKAETGGSPTVVTSESLASAVITTVTLSEPLIAGQSLSIAVIPAPGLASLPAETVTFARTWTESAQDRSPLQRTTGRETAAAVSDSGVPLATSAYIGKN